MAAVSSLVGSQVESDFLRGAAFNNVHGRLPHFRLKTSSTHGSHSASVLANEHLGVPAHGGGAFPRYDRSEGTPLSFPHSLGYFLENVFTHSDPFSFLPSIPR